VSNKAELEAPTQQSLGGQHWYSINELCENSWMMSQSLITSRLLGHVLHSFTQHGRKMTHFYGQRCVSLRIFIVGNCVALHINKWHKV